MYNQSYNRTISNGSLICKDIYKPDIYGQFGEEIDGPNMLDSYLQPENSRIVRSKRKISKVRRRHEVIARMKDKSYCLIHSRNTERPRNKYGKSRSSMESTFRKRRRASEKKEASGD